MPEATDKAAVTDEHILRVVAWAFRPLVEAMEGANGGAAYWQSRYDDAARRLLAAEAERDATREGMERLRTVVQVWLDNQVHDRCWYYPDLFNVIASNIGIEANAPAHLPPRAEFEDGCRRYQCEQYAALTPSNPVAATPVPEARP
jgi:hypothetical protein